MGSYEAVVEGEEASPGSGPGSSAAPLPSLLLVSFDEAIFNQLVLPPLVVSVLVLAMRARMSSVAMGSVETGDR